MYCPACGTNISGDQKFCRHCGAALEGVSQLIAARDPALSSDQSVNSDHQRQAVQRNAGRLGLILVSGASAIFYLSVCWAVISEIIIGKGHILGGILFLTVLTAVALGGLLLTYSSSNKRSGVIKSTQSTALSKEEASSGLLRRILPKQIPSITEHTTELLEGSDFGDTARKPERRLKA
jgi:hypothetical protein